MHKKEITFWLSGGKKNIKANKSIGGMKSDTLISNVDLFDTVTATEALSGSVIHRCFYVINENPNEKLKNLILSINEDTAGINIEVGVMFRSEIQAIIVSGQPPRGFFQILYVLKQNGLTNVYTSRQINWTTNPDQVADSIAGALNSSNHLEGVKCIGSQTSSGYDFLITFRPGRQQEVIGVVNEIGVDMSVIRVQQGGPINTIAPNIGFDNNTPNGVKFYKTSNDDPIKIGDFYPEDVIPIWLKRTILPNTKSGHGSFSFNLSGDATSIFKKTHTIDITPHTKH